MKKVLLILTSLIVTIILVLVFFVRSSSGFRSIYFVPEDAVMIIETSNPVEAWNQIVYSQAWNHFSTNEYFKELNEDILSYDSLISSSKFLLKLIGKKAVTVSRHHMGNNNYEYVYIIDIGKVAKFKSPEKPINSILGKNYMVTSREYKRHKIVELFNKEESGYYFMAFSEGKLIFSFEPKLVEKALDASEVKAIGRDMKYLDVQSKIGDQGLFSVYFKFENLSETMSSLSADALRSYQARTKFMKYAGIVFDITEEGLFSMEGYTSFGNDIPADYFDILTVGSTEVAASEVIPLRIASFAKINFEDAAEYFNRVMKNVSPAEYDDYNQTMTKTEKKLKINFNDNLFSWMESELVMLQTQPSNLGRDNEFAAILHASDSAVAADNLKLMWKQIKKNTPVKIKSVNYKGYNIDFVAFPGIIKALFGKTLEKLEKPYITQLGKNVILSNHPQTLKNIIDDYQNNESLSSSVNYYNFNKNFDKHSSAFFYIEPPVLFRNLRAFLDDEAWNKFKKNKKFITCFDQAGIQLSRSDDLLHFRVLAQYRPNSEEVKKKYYNTGEIFAMFSSDEPAREQIHTETKDTLPKIIIPDLDAKKFEDTYPDGTPKTLVELRNGLKHGAIKQYHPNGKLKLKGQYNNGEPTGKWKYYNEVGSLIKTDKY